MQTLNTDIRCCTKPEIVAGRLASIRNIYLRQELRTIAHQIQEKHKERLPTLQLVSTAAYEQPLSLPEVLRQDAVKYGLRYYELNMEKLQIAEAPTVSINRNLSEDDQIDENQLVSSYSQRSVSSKGTKSDDTSNRSSLISMTSGSPSHSTSSDTNSIASSDGSPIVSTNKRDFSTTSTFSDTNLSLSSADTSSSTDLSSSSTNTRSVSASSESMTNTTIDQSSASGKKLSRTKPPKIIVRRPSNNNLTSSNSKKPSGGYRLSPTKRKKKKSRNKNAIVGRVG